MNDGVCKSPQEFYVGLDFAAHAGDTTVLVDAGLGDLDVGWARGGPSSRERPR